MGNFAVIEYPKSWFLKGCAQVEIYMKSSLMIRISGPGLIAFSVFDIGKSFVLADFWRNFSADPEPLASNQVLKMFWWLFQWRAFAVIIELILVESSYRDGDPFVIDFRYADREEVVSWVESRYLLIIPNFPNKKGVDDGEFWKIEVIPGLNQNT